MSTLLVFSFLFFYSSGDHPDLHSFPTRRSSDLACPISHRNRRSSATSCCIPNSSTANTRSTPGRRMIRSEEHTSELQSLRHLVCRLLLEKKKKKITQTSNTTKEKQLCIIITRSK